ncbi:MAG: hypothetical protein WEB58_01440 [Planctomycetaceae bacterium]
MFNMSGHPEVNEPKKGAPTCGILSLAVPLIGIPIAIGVGRTVQWDSWDFVVVFVFLIYGTWLIGLTLALIGLLRGESFRILSVLGLILNIGIFLWATRH